MPNRPLLQPKIGLALGAGGARGFCHVGALQVLTENNISADVITGSSMGSLVGGAYAAGVTLREMEMLSGVIGQSFLMDIGGWPVSKLGFVKGERITRLLKSLTKGKQIEDLPIRYACVACDLATGKTVLFDRGPLWQAVRSSISIPMVFQPMHIGNKVLVDGGVLCRVPVAQARALGADIVIAIDALGAPLAGDVPKGLISLIMRCYAIMDWEHTKTRLKRADIALAPEMGNKSELVFSHNEVAIKAGRDAMTQALPALYRIIEQWKEDRAAGKALPGDADDNND
ncbi:MAG: patatin-like phospholipase family protein [Clostridiales bacterium]|nr:patatin-like phospholipase family protein [Clostridiales bacterium]